MKYVLGALAAAVLMIFKGGDTDPDWYDDDHDVSGLLEED